MSTPADDGTIVIASVEDPERFGTLVERHHPAVHRYLARRVGVDHADDLAAETFAVAFRRRATYDGRPQALPWLLGIATRLAQRLRRDEVRALRAYARTGIDPFSPSHDLAADDRLDAAALAPELAGALAAMRTNHREALLLCAVGGLTPDEAGRALDVPPATIRSWLFRARATARRRLPAPTTTTSLSPEDVR
ncbi:RNA polymerase sigma factor [Patulibacter sp. NPDC049589]|uniref:RNA polymerase sigma factor n=1 Tax=Patulibacter sp. NPDC049589 TaxID=3154731 RepID=UPI00342F0776